MEPLPLKGVPKVKTCKDCVALPVGERPRGHPLAAPYPGPRCRQHHRVERRLASARAHDTRVARTYGIARGFYERLFAFQGGVCAICGRATGRAKRLAVDHDHRKVGDESVRGICCGPCNSMLAHCRDDPGMLRRAARYLEEPPAQQLLIAWNEAVSLGGGEPQGGRRDEP